MNHQLSEIWKKHSRKSNLPKFVQQRKYCFSVNEKRKEILFLGLNSVFVERFPNKSIQYSIEKIFKNLEKSTQTQTYFQKIFNFSKSYNHHGLQNSDIAYADMFYFRTKAQKRSLNSLMNHIDGIIFLEDQLKITQQLLENVIKPEVIIATSWEVMLFFGLFEDAHFSNWLNYDLEKKGNISTGHRIYEIKGINKKSNSSDLFLKETKLKGTRIICVPELNIKNNFINENEILTNEIRNEVKKVILKKVTNILNSNEK